MQRVEVEKALSACRRALSQCDWSTEQVRRASHGVKRPFLLLTFLGSGHL